MLEKVEAMLRSQCLSNPLPCWEDGSVRGSVLRHRKCLVKRETRYKICKLALNRHMLHAHIQDIHTSSHTQSLSFPLYFPAQGFLFPNDQRGLRKCDSYPICGQWMIFSWYKSFTRVSCHASLQRCQKRRGQMWVGTLNVENGLGWFNLQNVGTLILLHINIHHLHILTLEAFRKIGNWNVLCSEKAEIQHILRLVSAGLSVHNGSTLELAHPNGTQT